MFYTKFFPRCTLLLVFLTAIITPLYTFEKTASVIGVIKNLDPTKKIKKYIAELESFSSATSVDELAKFLKSLRAFTEEQTGIRISSNDLYNAFQNKVIELDIPIDPSDFEFLFSKQKDFIDDIDPEVALGCVFIACSSLMDTISDAFPIAKHFCQKAAKKFVDKGLDLITNSLEEI